ncbi:MAG TPA: serine/threonine-protein kinase [Planctomycetota bacterium]
MTPEDVVVGRLAVEKGFITEAQLEEARAERSSAGESQLLGPLLVAKGLITLRQLEVLLKEPPPARTLGKYSLIRQIGAGGMGVVYEAFDTILKRIVAVKMLSAAPGQSARENAQDEERFLREARLAGSLPKHPHVVGVHEAGRADGRPFLVMEYVPGVHFGQWRRTAGPRAQVALLRDVALAVHHAHEHGIVHRDLKPQNVIVDPAGSPRVTDFGLAKPLTKDLTESLTTSGMVVGTPSYMSPEQAMGLKTPDRRSDVYSLGVLLFEILADRTPFVADTAVEMLVKVIDHALPSLADVCAGRGRPAPDPALEAVCRKALAKKPDDRHPTAAAFADALTRWLEARPRRSFRGPAIAAAAILLGVAAVLAWPRPAPRVATSFDGHAGAVNAVAFMPDGARLLSGGRDRTVRMWDVATGASLRMFGPHGSKVEGLAVSPDGRLIAAVTEPEDGGGEVKLWPSEGGAPRDLAGHDDGVNALAFSRDGALLATGDQGGTLKVWDVQSGRERASWKAHARAVRGAAFSPDGRHLATSGWDHLVALWDVASTSQVAAFEGHGDGAWGVAFSPDGRLVASASSDKTARLWDVERRAVRRVLRGHAGVVVAVAFSPDGRLLATGSWDRTARLWEVESGLEIRAIPGHADSVWAVAFSPDGRLLATGGLDRAVRLWPLTGSR